MTRSSSRAATARQDAITTRKRPPAVDIAALDSFFSTLSTPEVDNVATLSTVAAPPDNPAADLFAEPEPPRRPERPSLRWRGCVVCGAKEGATRAHPDHDICAGCAADPPAAAARLAGLRAALVRQQHDQARRAEAAWAALSDEERARWAAWAELRAGHEAHTLDADGERRYSATRAAYAAPDHPRIPAVLRAYYHEEECLFWANAALADEVPRLDGRLAQLGVCLEDLGRTAEADALYAPKEAA